jgi:hypothetical protein
VSRLIGFESSFGQRPRSSSRAVLWPILDDLLADVSSRSFLIIIFELLGNPSRVLQSDVQMSWTDYKPLSG